MQKADESFRSPPPIRNRKCIATEAALADGELAVGGSENGCAALVALKSGCRKVFWCDRATSQPESLCARGKRSRRSIGFCE